MKKQMLTHIIVVLALVSIFSSGMQLVNVVTANPFFGVPVVDPVPGTTPPGIVISPQNNTIYTSNAVPATFNISKPELATAFKTGITLVRYTVDNKTSEVYSIYNSDDDAPGRQNFTYTANLTLPEGNHILTVYAIGVVYPNNISIFDVNNTSTVIFSVDTSSTPTENPSSISIYIVAFIAAIAIIVIIVIVKKRKY